jgi:hypothetical protein
MGPAIKPVVCIVTPGTRTANNGNWRTAARWSQMLRNRYKVIVQTEWHGGRADAMIALHARRSAASIDAFRQSHSAGLAVVLTGTDLYRDLPDSREAARSLELADHIVVLQDDALRLLAPAARAKAVVIFQSASPVARRRRADASIASRSGICARRRTAHDFPCGQSFRPMRRSSCAASARPSTRTSPPKRALAKRDPGIATRAPSPRPHARSHREHTCACIRPSRRAART